VPDFVLVASYGLVLCIKHFMVVFLSILLLFLGNWDLQNKVKMTMIFLHPFISVMYKGPCFLLEC
jgi:hypothetical protein